MLTWINAGRAPSPCEIDPERVLTNSSRPPWSRKLTLKPASLDVGPGPFPDSCIARSPPKMTRQSNRPPGVALATCSRGKS